MQHTLAFAPTDEDLQDFYFDLPVITLRSLPETTEAAEDTPTPDSAQAS